MKRLIPTLLADGRGGLLHPALHEPPLEPGQDLHVLLRSRLHPRPASTEREQR